MKFKEYLVNEKILKYRDIERELLKNIELSSQTIDSIVRSLELYLNPGSGVIFLKQSKKDLVAELWFRLWGNANYDVHCTKDFITKFKKNFFNFVNKQSKNFTLEKNPKSGNLYFIHKDSSGPLKAEHLA